uniref:Uncharacterized protein n=1 Tax=Tetranychus urticae TaxID=32264 RepID=T1JZA3_TETUR
MFAKRLQLINKYGAPSKPEPGTDEPDRDSMVAHTQGFWNHIVQLIVNLFVVEHMVVNIAYAENVNMLVLGKRSTDNLNNQPHSSLKNGSAICEQLTFPSKLDLGNQKEATQILDKLSFDTKNLIDNLFSNLNRLGKQS